MLSLSSSAGTSTPLFMSPVIDAAKKAITDVNVLYVLPWISPKSEQEVRTAFEVVMHAREQGQDARVVADTWFVETVTRLHCQQQGIPYTELSCPASAAMRLANHAIEHGDIDSVEDFLQQKMKLVVRKNWDYLQKTAGADIRNTNAARQHTQATLSFLRLVYALYTILMTDNHNANRMEAVGKELLEQSYSKRHPATAQALTEKNQASTPPLFHLFP